MRTEKPATLGKFIVTEVREMPDGAGGIGGVLTKMVGHELPPSGVGDPARVVITVESPHRGDEVGDIVEVFFHTVGGRR